jgi:AcrR family transcriptional regulator
MARISGGTHASANVIGGHDRRREDVLSVRGDRKRTHSAIECRREQKRAMIIDVARRLVAEGGFEAMTVECLADGAGISKPTFYDHFSSKEALGICLLQQALREACDKLRAFETTERSDAALRSIIEWALEQHFGACQGTGFARSFASIENASLRVAERHWVSGLARLISRAQRHRTIRNRAPAQLIAGTLQSILKDPAYDRAFSAGTLRLRDFKDGVAQLLLG